MKNVAVVLSGCGVFDGAEINEVVLTLLALEQAGACYQAFAPNIEQSEVFDHYHQQTITGVKRNVLVESARIVRGNITDVACASAAQFDALIFPGGFGVAKNLCDFALQGEKLTIEPSVLKFATAMHQAQKPIGFICIAPVMAMRICGQGVRVTVGHEQAVVDKIQAMGGQHIDCAVEGVVVDTENRIVTTPAYMLAENISQAQLGISALVQRVLSM